MFTSEKIEEWIQEVRERPSSAPLVIQFIADRLRDLDQWNQKLRAENIEIRSGARIETYEREIAHLEYQLELLKRQIEGEVDLEKLADLAPTPKVETLNLIIYGPQGRVQNLQIDLDGLENGATLGRIKGMLALDPEPPRILITSSSDELMLIFTSGRICTIPVSAIPMESDPSKDILWKEVEIPEEPNLGETLACLAPISKMALAEFFIQISRRGYMKKIRSALAPTIMENKFIGTGVKVPADQTLALTMSKVGDRYVLVSYEGYMQVLPEAILPYAIVEAMRMGKSDHLVAAFPVSQGQSVLVMTQIGKLIHRSDQSLEESTDLQRKGRMLYSTARREAGVRVVGASAITGEDWAVTLQTDGLITLHSVSDLVGKGALSAGAELLDFVTFTPPGSMQSP